MKEELMEKVSRDAKILRRTAMKQSTLNPITLIIAL